MKTVDKEFQRLLEAEWAGELNETGRRRTIERAYPLYAGSREGPVGFFDLDQPVPETSHEPAPADWFSQHHPDLKGFLRICGPRRVQLLIQDEDRRFGWFNLVWEDQH